MLSPMHAPRKALPAIDPGRCTGCALCALRCPFDAIRMVRTTTRRGAQDQDIEAKVD